MRLVLSVMCTTVDLTGVRKGLLFCCSLETRIIINLSYPVLFFFIGLYIVISFLGKWISNTKKIIQLTPVVPEIKLQQTLSNKQTLKFNSIV